MGSEWEIDAAGVQGSGVQHAGLRDECLNGEIFYSLKEAQIAIGQMREFPNPTELLSKNRQAMNNAQEAARGRERREFGVEQSGLSLLTSMLFEAMQQQN